MLLKPYLIAVLDWVHSLGGWGFIMVGVLYVLACLLFAPGSILALMMGFLFGVPLGTLAVCLSANLGECAAFLIGRTLGRDWIVRKTSGNPKFTILNEAVGKDAFKLVLLLRLHPMLPFNILNYALGLTKISFRDYALATFVGMLPESLMLVYVGSATTSLLAAATGDTESGPVGHFFFWTGLAATIGVAVLATRIAQRGLRAAQERLCDLLKPYARPDATIFGVERSEISADRRQYSVGGSPLYPTSSQTGIPSSSCRFRSRKLHFVILSDYLSTFLKLAPRSLAPIFSSSRPKSRNNF